MSNLDDVCEEMKLVRESLNREKSSDEMFEDMTYDKYIDNEKCVVYRERLSYRSIIFWKYDKCFTKDNWGQVTHITMQELEAINKKCKELGWLE